MNSATKLESGASVETKNEMIATIPLTDEQREAIRTATGGLVYNSIGVSRHLPEEVGVGGSNRAAMTMNIDLMCW